MNRCSIWNRLVFVLNPCPQAFKSYGLLFRVIREEKKMIIGNMQLKTVLYKNPCVSSMKLKLSINSKSIYVHFRPSKPISQELWIYACVSDIKKSCRSSYNQCELENRLLFASRTSNAIVIWLKSFTLLY